MSEFVITLMAVALINAIVSMISPEGDIKKYIRFAGAIGMLLAIISPLYFAMASGEIGIEDFFSDFDADEENYEEYFQSTLTDGGRVETERALKEAMAEKFEIKDTDFDVYAKIDSKDGRVSISSVTVLLHTTAIFTDHRDISEFINERLKCPCTVIYD